jgi:hypothetical protein
MSTFFAVSPERSLHRRVAPSIEVENWTITISEQEDDSGLMSVSLVADRDSDNAGQRASDGS